jgi:alkylhydroperoxidase/carboxymuconolactone decarboxylase family protein YurZ
LECVSAATRRRVGGFGKLNPDIVKGYTTLSRAGRKAGHLDEKTRELIALAVAVTCAATAASQYIPQRPGNGIQARQFLQSAA